MTDIFEAIEEEDKEPVQEVDLGLVSSLIERKEELDQKISAQNEVLQKLKGELEGLLREAIPIAMAGLKKVETRDGKVVTIKPKAHVNVPEKNREKYFKWLRANGYGDIVKESPLIVPLEDRSLVDLFESIREENPDFEFHTIDAVHASTTKALIMKFKADGTEFPQELFNIFEYEEAHIKQKKGKKK